MANEHTHPTPDGTRYPTNHVVALLDTREQAESAQQALQAAGFARDDIVVFHGHAGLAAIQRRETPLSRLGAALDTMSETGRGGRTVYMDGLRDGQSLLMVYAPQQDTIERAKAELSQHAAHDIVALRRWTVEPLDEQ